MTTLKVGTVLIAKESRILPNKIKITKGNKYPIIEYNEGNLGLISIVITDDNSKDWDIRGIENINQHFTIKRYTLTDLKDKKIAVKLRDYEEYKRLCDAAGDTSNDEFTFCNDEYYGFDYHNDGIYILNKGDLEDRILLESIDEIDLEDKVVNECETPAMFIAKLESEIARLKEENEELKESIGCMSDLIEENKQLKESQQSERTRMAWELVVKNSYMSDSKINVAYNSFSDSLKIVDSFLAKSK